MYDEMNNNTNTYNYSDTNTESGYIHYDSSSAIKQPKKKKKGGFGKTVAKCVVLALVFGSVSGAAFMGTNYIGRQAMGTDAGAQASSSGSELYKADVAPGTTTVANSSSDVNDVSDIVKNCMPSVVSITNVGTTEFQTFFGMYEQESQSSGSGIIIGRNDSEIVIVTNNHVVSGAKEISVYFNSDGEDADEDNVISAKVKGTDPNSDLAVVSVKLSDIDQETKGIIRTATFGESRQVKVGQAAVAIGNALGYGQSVTTGIISALGRNVTLQNDDGSSITNSLIQTDAAINPGNSGGALLNINGEVIGINSNKIAASQVEGMGYAIPISEARETIEGLMNQETKTKVAESERGFIGIEGVDVSQDTSQMYNMPMGVYISNVTRGGGAAKAGITKGSVITALNGSSVNSMAALQEQLQYYRAGETVTLTIETPGNNGEYTSQDVEVTLGNSTK